MRLIDPIELKRAISVAAMSNNHKTLEQIIDEQPTIEERKTGTPLLEKRLWIEGYENRWYRKNFYCASCGIKIRTESWDEKRCFGEGTILKKNDMPNFCPHCGAVFERSRQCLT